MKRVVTLLTLILSVSFAFAGTVIHTYYFNAPQVEVINGQTTVVMPGTVTWGKIGEPLLPHSPVKLLLPPGEEATTIRIEVGDPVIIGDGYRIPHRQQPYPLSLGPSITPTPPNTIIYSSDDPYPVERWDNLQTQFLAGHGIGYAVIYPVSYRPVSGELSYYPWMQVTVESHTTQRSFEAHGSMLKRTESIDDRLSKMVQNPETVISYGPVTGRDNEMWDMLVVTMADFVDDYQEFIDYKNCSGILTTVETVEDIYANYEGLDNQDKIRNCIIDYYENHDILYVFLCGDSDQVPHRGLWCQDDHLPSDMYYAGLDGTWNNDGDDHWGEPGEDDLIAEVFVGRSCADYDVEIANVVNKNLKYQTDPVVDEVETALFLGEDLGWEIWAWEYQEEIRLGSSSWGYTTAGVPANVQADTLYERPGSYWSAMGDLLPMLNQGPNLVSHLGHANEYYVFQFNLGSINDYNFTNDGENHNFFIAYSQGCYPGAFDYNYPDCICEAFTTIAHGAVGFVGNSRYGWGDYSSTNGPSQHFNRQFLDAVFAENITLLGPANHDSKEDNIWMVSGDNLIRWCFYETNLFGDPTLDIWTSLPGVFEPRHPLEITLGSQSITVIDIAVEGALVTASMNGEVLGMAETNGSGEATITFESVLVQLGELDLVITDHDMIPYQGVIDVVSPNEPFVIFSDYVVEDGTTGNGNGQLDYSESALLTLSVENVGLIDATNVTLTINSSDPLLTITDPTEFLGDLTAGAVGTVEEGFAMDVSSEIENEHVFEFMLTASNGDTSWNSPFSIMAYAPIVYYDGLLVCDTGGNFDEQLEPGETGNFELDIINGGGADAPDVTFTLNCDHPLITIAENTAQVAQIAAGEGTSVNFGGISADEEMPQGEIVEFTLDIEATGGYTNQETFNVTVGDVRYDPLGPDSYGYFAYDMYDGGGSPEYDWIEIAPMAGGSGTDLQLGNNDTITVSLPFDFQFYGETFNEVLVSSNGWLAFGPQVSIFPLNRPIPDFIPPNNLIAAFWDELMPGAGGQVSSYYDESERFFIVEWCAVPHAGSPASIETFEIVLYDPGLYMTQTGDGNIVVNYQIVSDMTNGCTVGIEDANGMVGLQFLCDDDYDELSMPLEAEFAIRFSTDPDLVSVDAQSMIEIPAEYSVDQNYPNPFNPSTTISFALPRSSYVNLVVYNIAGQTVAELVDGFRQAGYHNAILDASSLASGLYFYRIEAGDFNAVRKMVLIK